MKHAKKLLAVMMVVAMIAAFSAIAFAANPKVVFTVGEYSDGKATVSAVFSDCVGLKSGNLKFAYAKDAVTKIAKKNGADVKAIGDVDNAFAHEFNSSANPAESGFYFKDVLWDSATWADAENADETVNGENFEFATFDFTAAEGTVITVTGELKIGDETVAVNDSFTIGKAAAPVETTAAPAPVETTAAPAPAETTTAKTTPAETTTAKTTPAETTTAKSSAGETTTAKSAATETTTAKTTPSKTTPGQKTDNGKKTGDNSVLAVMAGVIALAGAAFVVTKKRK